MLRPESPGRSTARAKLRVEGISKRYRTVEVLQPTHLEIAAGELVTILGPSGSGKTTLLQIICGLVEPTAGRLLIDGEDRTHTPAGTWAWCSRTTRCSRI